eukprot:scaffold293542_cov36-Tisochrysis_lutea.AAC.2
MRLEAVNARAGAPLNAAPLAWSAEWCPSWRLNPIRSVQAPNPDRVRIWQPKVRAVRGLNTRVISSFIAADDRLGPIRSFHGVSGSAGASISDAEEDRTTEPVIRSRP